MRLCAGRHTHVGALAKRLDIFDARKRGKDVERWARKIGNHFE